MPTLTATARAAAAHDLAHATDREYTVIFDGILVEHGEDEATTCAAMAEKIVEAENAPTWDAC